MTNPDYRALCAELSKLDGHCVVDCTEEWADAMCRLRALLAQPVADGPTDEEIISQADKFLAYSDAHMGDPARWEGSDVDLVAFTRHAIARWGHPAPVPVSEPGPGPEDCDAEGQCWWFNPGQPAMSNPHIATSSWRLCRMINGKPMGTHFLPAHALPFYRDVIE